MVRRVVLAAVVVVVLFAGLPAAAGGAAVPVPGSMAATGDSITRAYNACGWFSDCTTRSWSTGSDAAVNSHYLRIVAKNSAMTGHNFNDAKTGAKMADLNGQLQTAVGQHVDYVTVLMGANDACTSSESTMTSVATFQSQLHQALTTLKAGLPNTSVFVSSIPDIFRLWTVGKDTSAARSAWSLFRICQSMLANPTSTAQADVARRTRVRQRVIDFNAALSAECTAYGANCKFDANAVFNYPFVLSQINTWDYFHPNTAGQAVLASVTYNAGFGW
jgi:lysophospholipase L1-like esterase